MTRDDVLLLPICQVCGKYKGVGPCKDSNCSGSKISPSGKDSIERIIGTSHKVCSLCESEVVASCCRCNCGFCEIHGSGKDEGQLVKWDQRVGICSICKQVVCENCWILQSDGAIICLAHHEGGLG